MKITERLDIVADNMWNRGNWGSDLDTVKDAKEHIEKLENILRKAFPENSGHYFICGELGNKDNNGLPDKIEICPAYGNDRVSGDVKDFDTSEDIFIEMNGKRYKLVEIV